MNKNNNDINLAYVDCPGELDEAVVGRQINETLGDDFEFLGLCRCDDRLFTVLKTGLEKGGEKTAIMVMEIDETYPISEFSFSIIDERDLFFRVFREFCVKYRE